MTSLLALGTSLLLAAGGSMAPKSPVKGVDIRPAAQQTEVVISVDGKPRYRDFMMDGPERLVIDFLDARHALPRDDYMGINRGGIRAVRTSQYSSSIVRVVVELDRRVDYHIQQVDGQLRLLFDNTEGSFQPWSTSAYGGAGSGADAGDRVATSDRGTTARSTGVKDELAAATRRAQGDRVVRNLMGPGSGNGFLLQEQTQPITVTFTDTPIQNVLFTFAEFSGRSIVPGAQVQGNVTADIRSQPWDVALRTILEAQGLTAQETESGIIRVDDVSNLAQQDSVEPMVTRPFRVNYATAQEIQSSIQPLLSSRGSISVGSGTNTVIVTDLPRIVQNVADLLNQLDVRTPQVQISSKIIFVDRTDLNEFGIIYDLKDSQGNQINTFSPGGQDTNHDGQIELPEEQVDQGTDVVSLGGSSIAALGNASQTVSTPSLLALTSLVIGRHTLVNFIQALEDLNLSSVQATPTLTVLDNQEARVQVGQDTPLRVVDAQSSSGGQGIIPRSTVQFRNTGIILQVTPHVTSDENILMELHAERSNAQIASSDVGFVFNTQSADSRVLVKDGETVVIGGLTVTQQTEARSGIPLLMSLPLLGRLFRVTRHQQEQQDLMILVTPHIVREDVN